MIHWFSALSMVFGGVASAEAELERLGDPADFHPVVEPEG